MEMPVVATNVAAEGIQATEGDGLFIIDDKVEFAKTIIELCKNFESTRNLGQKARIFVSNNFSWEKNVKIMIDGYNKIIKMKKILS